MGTRGDGRREGPSLWNQEQGHGREAALQGGAPVRSGRGAECCRGKTPSPLVDLGGGGRSDVLFCLFTSCCFPVGWGLCLEVGFRPGNTCWGGMCMPKGLERGQAEF